MKYVSSAMLLNLSRAVGAGVPQAENMGLWNFALAPGEGIAQKQISAKPFRTLARKVNVLLHMIYHYACILAQRNPRLTILQHF